MEQKEQTALLGALKDGDEQAFEQIFRQYHQELCHFCLRYVQQATVAEELVHDTFMYLWQHRAELQINTSLGAYLYAGTRNRAINYLKSRYARQQFQEEIPAAAHPADLGTEQRITVSELQQVLQAGIDSLPEKCRIIFTLRQSTDMTYEEIGQELGISKKTVAAQMAIALGKLKEYLGRYWQQLLLIYIFSHG